jgi:alpha-ketoglutarate-dependent taurine dioxygenase
MESQPTPLETHAEWRAKDVADPEAWIERLSRAEQEELDAALRHASAVSPDLMQITRDDFPLPTFRQRLAAIEHELINGRGFVLIRGLERERYSQEEMELLYWGIGMHLGEPWPQNKHGHVLGDVTDQGKKADDATARGNELGGIALPYHSDGSDLVGLLCLQTAQEGGISTVANAVAIHNELVREAPELAASMYMPQPFDYRGEQKEGARPWYDLPVFTRCEGRLFVRYIRPYIEASQRHEGVPAITPEARAAMDRMDAMSNDPSFNVFMDLQPGDMQFVNNFHVLHARTAYEDDRAAGKVRHLKRLWLETRVLDQRPPHFQNNTADHWGRNKTVSRLRVQ